MAVVHNYRTLWTSPNRRFSVGGGIDVEGNAVLGLDDSWQSPGDPPNIDLTKDQLREVIGELTLLWKEMQ